MSSFLFLRGWDLCLPFCFRLTTSVDLFYFILLLRVWLISGFTALFFFSDTLGVLLFMRLCIR